MDDGGIYEEGSPEQIFDHPQKERTRRFIHRLKVFETEINSKDYDFIVFGTELDRYLMQNDVAASTKYKIRLAIEEVVQQILLPQMKNPHICITVEYSMENKSADITISYGGEAFDIRTAENELSLALIRNSAKEIHWELTEGAEYGNRLEIMGCV